MFKNRYTIYQLNNGDIITSITNKRYLINAYPFENSIPDFMSFIPLRNFQRKSINCQQLEMPDVNACSSQLIVFKSQTNLIPSLDNITLMEFISNDEDLRIFNNLLDVCGTECKSIFENLVLNVTGGFKNSLNGGYTILLPTNDYFNKAVVNFDKFSRNLPILKKTILSNIFYGTNCMFYLKMNVVIENLLNRKIKSKKVYNRIIKPQAYLSENGILVHKSQLF